jgi:hypothetical protein
MNETVLSVLPGVSANDRVMVVHRLTTGGVSELVLRKESWSEKVGWFDQGSVELSPDQVRDLRASLGSEPRYRVRHKDFSTEKCRNQSLRISS